MRLRAIGIALLPVLALCVTDARAVIQPVSQEMRPVAVRGGIDSGYTEIRDNPVITVGADYGTHTGQAHVEAPNPYFFGTEIFQATSVITSVVSPTQILAELSVRTTWGGETGDFTSKGLADATIVFDITERGMYRFALDIPGWTGCAVTVKRGPEFIFDRGFSEQFPGFDVWEMTSEALERGRTPELHTLDVGQYELTMSLRPTQMPMYLGNSGGFGVSIQAVPEPAALSLLPLAGLALRRRR